jgi:hypothetical protein
MHRTKCVPITELEAYSISAAFLNRVPAGNRTALVIYCAYYDESDLRPGFSLAGYSAAYDTWVHLDWAWKGLLNKWNLRYFKASECENLLKEFAQYRDDPKDHKSPLKPHERERQKEIKREFIDAICKHHDDLQGYGAVVVLEDFERLIAEDSRALSLFSDKPYYICFQLCLLAAAYPVRDANQHLPYNDRIRVKPIFDTHEEYSALAKVLFDRFCEKNPKSAQVLLPPDYESDVEVSALQVADTLAYEARKLLARKIRDPHDDYMRPPLLRLLPSLYRMYRLDYDALKLTIERQRSDAIPQLDVRIEDLLAGGPLGY